MKRKGAGNGQEYQHFLVFSTLLTPGGVVQSGLRGAKTVTLKPSLTAWVMIFGVRVKSGERLRISILISLRSGTVKPCGTASGTRSSAAA